MLKDMIAPTERPTVLTILFMAILLSGAYAYAILFIRLKINTVQTIKTDIETIMEICDKKQIPFLQLKKECSKINNSVYTNPFNKKTLSILDLFEKDFKTSEINENDKIEIKLYQSEEQTKKKLRDILYYYHNYDLKIGCLCLQK